MEAQPHPGAFVEEQHSNIVSIVLYLRWTIGTIIVQNHTMHFFMNVGIAQLVD